MNVLANISESDLLRVVLDILSKPGKLTAKDREELAMIKQEILRRDDGEGVRQVYAIRRLRQLIREETSGH